MGFRFSPIKTGITIGACSPLSQLFRCIFRAGFELSPLSPPRPLRDLFSMVSHSGKITSWPQRLPGGRFTGVSFS